MNRATGNVCILIGLTLAAFCGCNKQTYVQVSGQVLIDGQPLAHGTIGFVPTKGRAARSNLDSNGRFTLMTYKPGDGVVLGTHRIEIKGVEQIGTNPVKFKWHAPEKYANFAESGLTEEITGPTDSIKIELKWPKGQKPFVISE
jgi:hypothetical protein